MNRTLIYFCFFQILIWLTYKRKSLWYISKIWVCWFDEKSRFSCEEMSLNNSKDKMKTIITIFARHYSENKLYFIYYINTMFNSWSFAECFSNINVHNNNLDNLLKQVSENNYRDFDFWDLEGFCSKFTSFNESSKLWATS